MIDLRLLNKEIILLCFCISIVTVFSGCSTGQTYEGRVIQIDFQNMNDIKDEEWIEVDGVRYTHYEHFQKAYKDEYSLPASREVYYLVKEDNNVKRFAPVSDFAIAIALGNFIDLTHSKKDTTLARVKINQRYLMHTFGKLILQRPDSTEFTVRTSEGYPARISVKSE